MDVDDVVQEVAFRALSDLQRFESEEHLVRWCCRVAINLHIDATRRQRRVSPDPPPEVAAPHDTAVTVERRMALEKLMGGIAGLSPEEQQLLFAPATADSRREAVRLAVRRHRLRARLAALLEGVVVFFALLRRASRNLSTPTKVAIAATPVVAGLLLAPLAIAPHSHPQADTASEPAVELRAGTSPPTATDSRTPGTSPAPSHHRPVERTAPTTAPSPPSSARTLVELRPAGTPVSVTKDHKPDDTPPLCLFGLVNGCVNPPGPQRPHPTLPPR
jgi:hypothetical protein